MDVEDYTGKIVAAQTTNKWKNENVSIAIDFNFSSYFLSFLKWFINLKCRQLLCKELKFLNNSFYSLTLIENGKSF